MGSKHVKSQFAKKYWKSLPEIKGRPKKTLNMVFQMWWFVWKCDDFYESDWMFHFQENIFKQIFKQSFKKFQGFWIFIYA